MDHRYLLSGIAATLLLCAPAWGATQSTCYGTTAKGRLEGGVELPAEGPNFTRYSTTAALLGRTYVHSRVRDILLDAYRRLETSAPGMQFKYAETGFAEGGRFRPHKTHQNGLSVDFMVPAVDAEGHSVELPTHPFNKFGYAIEFDAEGRFGEYRIDFPAMAAHLAALHRAALAEGAEVWRVIFDPQLQPRLFATADGAYLRQHLQFSTRRSWVRHDEHYHVDFVVPCRPM